MLWGEVTDHPLLGTASIHTSQLIAIDPEAGWARTASRWYRLGRSIDALAAELAESMNGKRTAAGAKDDDLVVGAIRILENHGAKVYVDEVDPEMPP